MFFSKLKNNVYPYKPQFYYIKVGFKGINGLLRRVFVMNQHAHPCSLIRVFVICVKGLCVFGYSKCHYRRVRSDCTNMQADLNLLWVHMSEGTFADVDADASIMNLVQIAYKA